VASRAILEAQLMQSMQQPLQPMGEHRLNNAEYVAPGSFVCVEMPQPSETALGRHDSWEHCDSPKENCDSPKADPWEHCEFGDVGELTASEDDGWARVECGEHGLGIFDPRMGWFRLGCEGEWVAVGSEKRKMRALSDVDKQLFEACSRGDLAWVVRCLSEGHADAEALKCEDASRLHSALPAGVSHERFSPLLVACEGGHLPVVAHLIEKAGVNPRKPSPTGLTPLIAACQSDNATALARYLIAKSVDPEVGDGHGFSALWVACRNGDEKLVHFLVNEAKVNPSKIGDPHAGTPLMAASAHGHLGIVQFLIESCHVDTSACDIFGDDAYAVASCMGHEEVAQYLEAKGVSNNSGESLGCVMM